MPSQGLKSHLKEREACLRRLLSLHQPPKGGFVLLQRGLQSLLPLVQLPQLPALPPRTGSPCTLPEKDYNLPMKALPYLAVTSLVAAVTLPLFLLREQLSVSTLALFYLLPVLISAALWGLIPGLAAGFLAFLAFNYFFLLPYYTLTVHETQDFVALVIFFFVAGLISQLVGHARRSLASARNREEELLRLHELNNALAGAVHLDQIVRALKEQALAAFHAGYVEISVETPAEVNGSSDQGQPRLFSLGKPPREGGTPASAKLETPRGVYGEIRLWRGQPLQQVEVLLLGTFATQGALAIERARLSQAETRAGVLAESDRLKSILLSSVSHELRTPLATIKAAVTSLQDANVDWEPEARQELMSVIDEETDHLNSLVGNLLDMTRLEAGALKTNKQWNILSETIHRVVAQLHRPLEDRQVIIDVPENLPLVPMDAVQMEQVFKNLLSNSIKYSPSGLPIHLRVWTGDPQTVQVQVTNYGPQVASEHLERIFDKFYRITHAEKVSGTGLGLSICKGIIQSHGGQIWAENLPEGFSFRFSLPLEMDGAPPPVVESEAE
jgi:two-component system, OmpR family, sensor histidine kinase KdpD